jgi:hypothetical protein
MLALLPVLTDEVPSSFSFGGHLASKSFSIFGSWEAHPVKMQFLNPDNQHQGWGL